MILLIDNYDSFSYNLYQLVGEIDPDIQVIRNDELTTDEICGPPASSSLPAPDVRRTQVLPFGWCRSWAPKFPFSACV